MNNRDLLTIQEDSFIKRYAYKLIATFAIIGLNVVVQMFLPRALGMVNYGYFNYNLNTFTAIISIANLSCSSAFISKIAKRRNERRLIRFYGIFFMIMLVVLDIAIIGLHLAGLLSGFFEGQEFLVVLLALNATVALQLMQDITGLFDSYVMTRYSETLRVIQMVLLAALVFGFYAFNLLTLDLFYVMQIATIITIVALLAALFVKRQRIILSDGGQYYSTGEYAREFAAFCSPVVLATVMSNLIMLLSNWLLMHFGGSTQQAEYGVAFQLNSLAIYIYTPIIALSQREYAVRVKDRADLSRIYGRTSRTTLVIVCFFAAFIFANAENVLGILFGSEYIDSATVTRVIMLYTIYQALGQVNGSMYVASERTRSYSLLSIAGLSISVLTLLLFQIPNFIFPVGLGSLGIGLQRLAANVVSIPLMGFFNSRYLKRGFVRDYFGHFFIVIGASISLAYIARYLTTAIGLPSQNLLNLLLTGFCYTIFFFSIVLAFPKISGLDRATLNGALAGIKNKFKR